MLQKSDDSPAGGRAYSIGRVIEKEWQADCRKRTTNSPFTSRGYTHRQEWLACIPLNQILRGRQSGRKNYGPHPIRLSSTEPRHSTSSAGLQALRLDRQSTGDPHVRRGRGKSCKRITNEGVTDVLPALGGYLPLAQTYTGAKPYGRLTAAD